MEPVAHRRATGGLQRGEARAGAPTWLDIRGPGWPITIRRVSAGRPGSQTEDERFFMLTAVRA